MALRRRRNPAILAAYRDSREKAVSENIAGARVSGAAADEPASNAAFGWTVGGALIAIGALKALLAGGPTPLAAALAGCGALLVLLAFAAPAHLALPHRLWLRLGAAMAVVVNPLVVALLFVVVVTPMAIVMRLCGKRPLHLRPDPGAGSYWIERDRGAAGKTTMRQQF